MKVTWDYPGAGPLPAQVIIPAAVVHRGAQPDQPLAPAAPPGVLPNARLPHQAAVRLMFAAESIELGFFGNSAEGAPQPNTAFFQIASDKIGNAYRLFFKNHPSPSASRPSR